MSLRRAMDEVRRERERLLERCDTQRNDMAALAREWSGPLEWADRAVAAVHYLRQHPILLGAVVAGLAIIQRRGWWQWVQRGLVVWRAYRAFRESGSGRGV